MHDAATETRLPPLLLACCDDASPQLARPWLDVSGNGWAFATDGRIAVRARSERLDWAAAVGLKRGGFDHPQVNRWFSRWRPDGRTLILPLGVGPGRARVRLAPGLDLAACRVALLLEHGVREVQAGFVRPGEPAAPVRFEAGVIEGLLMPLREMVR